MSRTAALSRYLAALDGPSPYEETKPTSMESSSKKNKPKPQAQPSELVTSLTMDDDVSAGRHKVVVAPSSLGMSVRDIVSSRNQLPDGRPRSRSAGRAPMRSSRDIVQDVYQRMGVDPMELQRSRDSVLNERSSRSHAPQRTRSGEAPVQEQQEQQPTGTPSSAVSNADAFHERYRAAAALSSSIRGRNNEGGERRSRSLGRQWPPGRSVQTAGEPPSTTSAIADIQPMSASELLQSSKTMPTKPVTPTTSSSTRNDAHSVGGNTGSGHSGWKKPSPIQTNTTSQVQDPLDRNEDRTESTDSAEKDGEMPPPGSVKDRLSAYSGSSKRNFPRTYPSHYASKRDHPPKIDIYEEIRRAEEAESELHNAANGDQDSSAAPTADVSKPSTTAPAGPPAATDYRPRSTGSMKGVPGFTPKSQSSVKSPTSPRTNRNSSSGVAGAFLSAINNNPSHSVTASKPKRTNGAPVTEVATTPVDDSGLIDGTSVLSGLSGDEFVQSPRGGPGGFQTKGRPSWSERNKLTSYQKMSSPVVSSPANGVRNGGSVAKTAEVDKLVDERVQAQVKALESSMAARMQELETKLEGRIKTHMAHMEAKIEARMDEILNTIASMLNHGKNNRNFPGHQEI